MATFRTSRGVSAADPSVPHLILVGLPGAGKSSAGHGVATRLGRTFLDFDAEIERREQRTIGQIFGEDGEFYFRNKERELSEELRLLGNMVLTPGGGWITSPENVGLLRPPGRIIYLRAKPETVLRRMSTSVSQRPLLARGDALGELRRLLSERQGAYEGADHIISTEMQSLEEVIEKVTELASIVVGK